MRTCFSMDPLTLDPRKSGDQITSVFLSMLYEGLTRLTPDGSNEFALAESLEILDKGRTYLFTLREAYWSNGDPIEAKDFEISWKQSLDPQFPNPCRHLFYLLKGGEKAAKGLISLAEVGVTAIGEKILRVELESPSSHFLSLTSLTNFFPVSPFLQTKAKNTEWIDPAMIPVSGPFRLASWQRRESILLKKNALYWDQEDVTLDEAKIYICKNPYLVTHMFDDGEIDLIS
ncbi:MAG TPA: ABC transporter substrate-binding protein, partial [Chlamydiales bacterium]